MLLILINFKISFLIKGNSKTKKKFGFPPSVKSLANPIKFSSIEKLTLKSSKSIPVSLYISFFTPLMRPFEVKFQSSSIAYLNFKLAVALLANLFFEIEVLFVRLLNIKYPSDVIIKTLKPI